MINFLKIDQNQTAWKNSPVPGHLNLILTARMSYICLKTQGRVQQAFNCIKLIIFFKAKISPSQTWVNFRKSHEISRFLDKDITKNFRSEIFLCRVDSLTCWIGLRDVHLVNDVTPLIFWRNLILDACTCNRTLSIITKFSWPYRDRVGKKGQRLFRKLRALVHFWQFLFHDYWIVS